MVVGVVVGETTRSIHDIIGIGRTRVGTVRTVVIADGVDHDHVRDHLITVGHDDGIIVQTGAIMNGDLGESWTRIFG